MKTKLHHFFILLALLAGIHRAAAQGTTAFTYQGQLRDGGTNANGTYTMMFKLYDSSGGNNQIGSTITTSPTLANGLFTVNLDFGLGAFNGSARWLDITVTSGATTQTLSPRVQVLADPYAQFAAVAATVTNGAIMNAQLASNAVNTTNIQNGAITTMQIAAGAVTNANLTANAVATTNIQNSAITTAQIANGAVTTALIANGAVTNQNLAANAVATINIQNSAVTNPQLAANAVATLNIQSNAITTALITNNAVTDAKIVSVSGSKVSGAVALATSLTDGIWNSSVETFNFPNAFVFSASGTPQMAIFPSQGVGIANNLYVGGQIEMGGNTISEIGTLSGYNNLISITTPISVTGNASISGTVSATAFDTTSDRNLKEKFRLIDNQEILERVTSLPISSWNFKQDANTRHIGPMAQDFYAAFNVGTDDKHIATVDEGGVALAAIQGLNEKLKEKDAQIEALNKRLADLEQLVKTSAQK